MSITLVAAAGLFGCTGPDDSDSSLGGTCTEAATIEDLQGMASSGADHFVCANSWEGELVVEGSALEFEEGSVISSAAGTPLTIASGPAAISGLSVQGGVGTTAGSYVVGGCVLVQDDVEAAFSEMTVSGCSAQVGAGIWIGNNSVVSLDSVSVENNEATEIGGGINVQPNGQLQVSSLRVSDNTAFQGGGLQMASGASLMGDSEFVHNSAVRGAGVLISGGTISGATLSGNAATADGGGALVSDGQVINCAFLANSAGNDGGGLYTDGELVVARGSRFVENRSEREGGGVEVGSLQFALIQSEVLLNEAGHGDGGGVSMSGGVHALCSNETNWGGAEDSNSPADLAAGSWAEIDGVATFTCEPGEWPCQEGVVASWWE